MMVVRVWSSSCICNVYSCLGHGIVMVYSWYGHDVVWYGHCIVIVLSWYVHGIVTSAVTKPIPKTAKVYQTDSF